MSLKEFCSNEECKNIVYHATSKSQSLKLCRAHYYAQRNGNNAKSDKSTKSSVEIKKLYQYDLINNDKEIDILFLLNHLFEMPSDKGEIINNNLTYKILFERLKSNRLFIEAQRKVKNILKFNFLDLDYRDLFVLLYLIYDLKLQLINLKISKIYNKHHPKEKNILPKIINFVICPNTLMFVPNILLKTNEPLKNIIYLKPEVINNSMSNILNLAKEQDNFGVNYYILIFFITDLFKSVMKKNMPMNARELYIYDLLMLQFSSKYEMFDILATTSALNDSDIDMLALAILIYEHQVAIKKYRDEDNSTNITELSNMLCIAILTKNDDKQIRKYYDNLVKYLLNNIDQVNNMDQLKSLYKKMFIRIVMNKKNKKFLYMVELNKIFMPFIKPTSNGYELTNQFKLKKSSQTHLAIKNLTTNMTELKFCLNSYLKKKYINSIKNKLTILKR